MWQEIAFVIARVKALVLLVSQMVPCFTRSVWQEVLGLKQGNTQAA